MKLKIKNAQVVAVPAFPKQIQFAFDELTPATVRNNGSFYGDVANSALGKRKIEGIIIKKPCRVTLTAKTFTIEDVEYFPKFRLSCNGEYVVGGTGGKDKPQCNNIPIPDGATGIAFDVEWRDSENITIATGTGNTNILAENYQTGDITLTISKP